MYDLVVLSSRGPRLTSWVWSVTSLVATASY